MGAQIASYDWAETALGPIESWPSAFQMLVGLMLDSRQPMFLAWGADRTWLYNDAFIPIAGSKHPGCLGRPARQVWAEAWGDLEPLFTTGSGAGPIPGPYGRFRAGAWTGSGKLARSAFRLSYTPARLEDGSVAGSVRRLHRNHRAGARQSRFGDRTATPGLPVPDQAPTFMAMLRGAEHRFEWANPRYLDLVGHRPVLGRTVAEALPDAVAQGYLDLLDQVFRSGSAVHRPVAVCAPTQARCARGKTNMSISSTSRSAMRKAMCKASMSPNETG